MSIANDAEPLASISTLPELRRIQFLLLANMPVPFAWAWFWLLYVLHTDAPAIWMAAAVIPGTAICGVLLRQAHAWADSELRCYPDEPSRIPLTSRQYTQIAGICAAYLLIPLWMWS